MREVGSIKTSPNSVNVLRGAKGSRIATTTEAGSAVSIPSDHAYGEAMELRFSSARASGFQGFYLHVDTSVAATGSIRGGEVSAKRSAAVDVAGLEGWNASAYARTDGAGDIDYMYGSTGEIQVDDGYTGTIAILAGLRAKVATEDGSTITGIDAGLTTGGFGVLVENESVTGGKTLDAVIGVKSTGAGNGFACLIDSRGTKTTVHDTDQVSLFKFLDDQGTVVTCSYDRSAGALAFA